MSEEARWQTTFNIARHLKQFNQPQRKLAFQPV